jgi:membrane-bound serine protease (ClpP class)
MASALRSPLWFARIVAAIVWLGAAAGTSAGGNEVVVLRATGIVDSVFAGYIAEGIKGAEADNAAAVVIELDTPGGNLEATWSIVQSLEGAKVPVIVWVSPAGARAASAGTFITLAANLAYMAPGTNIGAASPIDASGADIGGTLGEKVLNDAVAHMQGIARLRGRNEAWAVSTVTDAVSTPADEAVRIGGVNGLAGSLEEVLAAATGKEVSVSGQSRTLDLAGASVSEAGMNPFQGFLHLLSDPNVAFILFTIGFYGLLYELIHPNFVTGILGALSIILALIGFGSLPLNVAGMLLVGLGIVLLVLEATVTSHGLLTIGGVICFVLGASAFYTNVGDPLEPVVAVATPLLLVTTLTTGAFGALIAFAAIRSRRIGNATAAVAVPVGSTGVVGSRVAPRGSVYVAKEHWSARSQDGTPIDRGTHVRIVGVEGLTLVVEPEPSSSTGA